MAKVLNVFDVKVNVDVRSKDLLLILTKCSELVNGLEDFGLEPRSLGSMVEDGGGFFRPSAGLWVTAVDHLPLPASGQGLVELWPRLPRSFAAGGRGQGRGGGVGRSATAAPHQSGKGARFERRGRGSGGSSWHRTGLVTDSFQLR